MGEVIFLETYEEPPVRIDFEAEQRFFDEIKQDKRNMATEVILDLLEKHWFARGEKNKWRLVQDAVTRLEEIL